MNTPYSEAAYFDGNHCAHVAAREEHLRLEGIRKRCATARRSRLVSRR